MQQNTLKNDIRGFGINMISVSLYIYI